jgi:heme/copper-type cytochrome/quinol oxidase subunit 4
VSVGDLGGSRSPYLWTAAALGVLTLAALALALRGHMAAGTLAATLGLLAAAQVGLQAAIFMHLGAGPRLYAVLFAIGLAFAVAFAWSVGYLVHRMWG